MSRTAAVPGPVVLALLLAISPPLTGQEPRATLVPGELETSSVGSMEATVFAFEADGAGVLTAAARGTEGTDLVLLVTDADGQPLPEGRSDQDLGGDTGAEQVAVTLPRAGSYRIRVETFGSGAGAFDIGVSWLPFPAMEKAPDPDGSPAGAVSLVVSEEVHADMIDGAEGDYRDWFVVRPERDGTLTVATRSDGGDLILEAFENGDFIEAASRSDQDLQGESGNEAVTLAVVAGEAYHFRVSPFSEGERISYEVRVGLIGG